MTDMTDVLLAEIARLTAENASLRAVIAEAREADGTVVLDDLLLREYRARLAGWDVEANLLHEMIERLRHFYPAVDARLTAALSAREGGGK